MGMGALFKIDELAGIVSGHWVNGIQVAGEFELATDNRLDCRNKIFIALRGALFDAHMVVESVAAQGAAALIVNAAADIPWGKLNLPILAVDDTLNAYQMLARDYRRRLNNLQLLAVTGSVGKTSTKELLRAIGLAAFDPEQVYATNGNTNNQFGVPQNLLQLPDNCRYAVIEMGTNHFGEIAPLSCCAEPDVALVNSIAPCHLEFLHSLSGVAREKSEIFRFLKPRGVAVVPEYSAEKQILRRATAKFTTFTFGDEADLLTLPVAENSRRVVAQTISSDLIGNEMSLTFMTNIGTMYFKQFYLPLSGSHQCRNAAAAAAAAWGARIEPEVICNGLTKATLPGSRMKITRYRNATWINDAYNANPQSMEAALNYLADLKLTSPVVLVLGDMLELGVESLDLHCQVIREARAKFPGSRIFLVGAMMAAAAGVLGLAAHPEITLAADAPELEKNLAVAELENATILIKSSNGIGLSRLPRMEA